MRLALRAPVAAGVKVMLTVQDAEAARLVPQVLAEIAKSAALVPEIEMPAMAMAAVPVLLNVTDWAGLVDPSVVAAKAKLDGATLALAATPVPDNATVCGLFPAESLNVRVALRGPAAEGVNAMFTVQLEEGARVDPQLEPERTKSDAFVPVMEALMPEIAAAPLLARVTVCIGLVEPRFVALKESDEGLTVAELCATVPVPERETVSGDWPELSVNIRLAWRVPAAVGAKTKVAVQLEPPARVAPQVLLAIRKSPASGPERAMLLILIAAEPPLVSCTVCDAAFEPTGTFCHDTLEGLTNTATTDAQPVNCRTQIPKNAANHGVKTLAVAAVGGRGVAGSCRAGATGLG